MKRISIENEVWNELKTVVAELEDNEKKYLIKKISEEAWTLEGKGEAEFDRVLRFYGALWEVLFHA